MQLKITLKFENVLMFNPYSTSDVVIFPVRKPSPLHPIISFMEPAVDVRYTFDYRESKYNIHFVWQFGSKLAIGTAEDLTAFEIGTNRIDIRCPCDTGTRLR